MTRLNQQSQPYPARQSRAKTGKTNQATPRLSIRQLIIRTLLGVGGLLMIGPFYWTLITSFKTREEIAAFPPTWFPQTFTLEHWRSLTNLTFGSFEVFFANSLLVVSIITALTLITSSATGYVFAKFDFPGRRILFVTVLAMMIVPFTVTLIPLYDLMATWGWTNSYIALVVPVLFNPFGIFLMRQFIADLPTELLDAARIDGASELGIYLRIVLPLSAAPLAALAIFTFTIQWDNFLWPLVILDSPDKYTLPLGLAQFRGRTGVDVGAVAAGSMISVLPVIVVYLLAQRRFIEGITLSGLKR